MTQLSRTSLFRGGVDVPSPCRGSWSLLGIGTSQGYRRYCWTVEQVGTLLGGTESCAEVARWGR